MCTRGSWWASHKKNTRDGTDIKAHQVTSWWWAREIVGTRSASGCTIKMRASGRSILPWCYVLEFYFQSLLVVPWGDCSRCSEHDGSTDYSNQRNANEATSHDGSFDYWNVNHELVEESKKAPCLFTFKNRCELQCEICSIHNGVLSVLEILPMNVADSIVTAKQHSPNIECSSPSPATFEIFLSISYLIIHLIHEWSRFYRQF